MRIVTPSRVSAEVLRFTRAGFTSTCTPKTRLISDLHTEEKTVTVSSRVGCGEFAYFSPFFIVRYVRSNAGVVYIGH